MTRWRSIPVVITSMVIAVLAGCSSEGEMSSSSATPAPGGTDAPITTTPTKPPPTSSTTTTTTTTTPPTTTTTSPEQTRAAAQRSWPDLVRAHGGSQLLHATGIRGLQPIGVMVPSGPDREGPMTIWVYEHDRWIVETQLGTSDPFRYASAVTLVDLTGDGNDEIYLDITPNAPAVQVFGHSLFGWGQVYGGTRISREGTQMRGYEQFCLWDCETLVLDIEVIWDGERFVEWHRDFHGNLVQLHTDRFCTAYQPREYVPLQLCDQGSAIYYLQDALYILGALNSSPTGVFDSATDHAVRLYQVLVGANVDGVVDGVWFQELMNAYWAGVLPSRR